jgi:hypothetical protein
MRQGILPAGVGEGVGPAVGAGVGTAVGPAEGAGVGAGVGEAVGPAVGALVGGTGEHCDLASGGKGQLEKMQDTSTPSVSFSASREVHGRGVGGKWRHVGTWSVPPVVDDGAHVAVAAVVGRGEDLVGALLGVVEADGAGRGGRRRRRARDKVHRRVIGRGDLLPWRASS